MTQAALKAKIKDAMMAKDELRLSVIRGLVAACTNELVAKGKKPTDELDEDGVMTLISRAVKQRKDSIEQFTKGGRMDLAEKETAELKILEEFLPAQMSEEEIEAHVRAKVAELGGVDKQKSGQFIGAVMKDLKGKADGMLVKSVVDRVLS